MASSTKVLENTCSPFVETPEETEARTKRIESRRCWTKFGDVNKTAGSERGITQKVTAGVALVWKGEEPAATTQKRTVKKSGTKPKAYKPPAQRLGKYAPPDENSKVELSKAAKVQKLITYCEDKMPPENSSGGKKKKKKKKQKLQHPMEFVSMFMELGISPPKTTNNLKSKIEALRALVAPKEEN